MSEDGGNEQSSASVGRGGIDPMLNAKLTRRKVQQDVELMGNRIERLRAEERKAKQKVMETKLRGQEILQLQKRNQQAHAAKELAKRLEMEQHTRDQQSQQLRRIEHRAALKSTYEAPTNEDHTPKINLHYASFHLISPPTRRSTYLLYTGRTLLLVRIRKLEI